MVAIFEPLIPNLDGSHVIVGGLVAVAFWLSRTLYVAIQQHRFQNGHDRRKNGLSHGLDADTIAWRATVTEQMGGLLRSMAATRQDIHDIRDNALHPLALRLALVEKDVQHLQRHCPLLEKRDAP